jgi:hypothetical protein
VALGVGEAVEDLARGGRVEGLEPVGLAERTERPRVLEKKRSALVFSPSSSS